MTDKNSLINDILDLRQQIGLSAGCYAFKNWQRLNVPVAQLKSLCAIICRAGVNYHTLAEDLQVTPGNVTGIIDRLVEHGLVMRRPDPHDRRVIHLEATDQGRRLFAELMETETRKAAGIMRQMSEQDLAAFAQGLRGFITAFEKLQAEQPVVLPLKES